MCQMRIVLKQGLSEQVVLENASLLEVTDQGLRVSALFEQPKLIQGATVREIDFLQGRVTVTKKEGPPATDPKTTISKMQILLPHWIEHNRNHAAEFDKWAASARAEGASKLAELLDLASAEMVATDAILKKALVEAGGADKDHVHDHHHHHD